MTGLDRYHTPKTRPMSIKRAALVACLDIGTSKIACMIARLKPCPPKDALRGRSHAVELIGYSQIQSRGVKAGGVVDLAVRRGPGRTAGILPPAGPQTSRPVWRAANASVSPASSADRLTARAPWPT